MTTGYTQHYQVYRSSAGTHPILSPGRYVPSAADYVDASFCSATLLLMTPFLA